MELAVATHTAPRDWRGESDAVLATALTVLEGIREQVEAMAHG